MKPTATEFMAQPKKALTLIGMSGVGKSHWGCKLEQWGWHNHSCDHLIGTEYLKEELGGGAGISADDILGLSEFVGQVGDPSKGGLDLAEFQRRQKMYYDAETQSLVDAARVIDHTDGNVIIDSTGSICENEDESVLQAVGDKSLFVYLKVRQAGHAEILKRAVDYPKPLYFPPAFLLERLGKYQEQFDVPSVEAIDPVEFLRWVFPFLFESRLEKYQSLADRYGISIYADKFNTVTSEEDFLGVIAEALEKG